MQKTGIFFKSLGGALLMSLCMDAFAATKPSSTCAKLTKAALSDYPQEPLQRLAAERPDIFEAIASKDATKIKTDNAVLESIYRENLKKYFSKSSAKDLYGFVKLYTGIAAESVDYTFFAEKKLVWTSQHIEDALDYAVVGIDNGEKQVFILELTVPKFMVYQRSKWPVLRAEDVQNLKPFVSKVATIPSTQALLHLLEVQRGDSQALQKFFAKKYTGFFETKSRHWKATSHD